jgi:hypothetical protein
MLDILDFKINNKFYYMFANDNDQHWGLTYVVNYLTNTEINLHFLRWKSARWTARIYVRGAAILQNYQCRLKACNLRNMMGYSEISYVVIYWQTDMLLSLTSICKTIQRRIENVVSNQDISCEVGEVLNSSFIYAAVKSHWIYTF